MGNGIGTRQRADQTSSSHGARCAATRSWTGPSRETLGSEYASKNYQEMLHQHNIQISMSRKGDCYDNAVIESFWGTLKEECFSLEILHTRKEAKTALFEYIEVFYNRKRKHSSLGYLSPVD